MSEQGGIDLTKGQVFGMLKRFDLPQVAGLIAPRPLAVLDPDDHMKRVIDSQTAGQSSEPARTSYSVAPNAYRLVFGEELASHIARE